MAYGVIINSGTVKDSDADPIINFPDASWNRTGHTPDSPLTQRTGAQESNKSQGFFSRGMGKRFYGILATSGVLHFLTYEMRIIICETASTVTWRKGVSVC